MMSIDKHVKKSILKVLVRLYHQITKKKKSKMKKNK